MPNLLAVTITAPVTNAIGPVVGRRGRAHMPIVVQGNFIYGSGGATVDAWVQTTVDGGATWIDVVQFHLTTSSLRQYVNLSSETPKTTLTTPTDGTLAINTAVDGVVGDKWRVKYTTTGTYAGGTQLLIDASAGS